MTARAVKHRRTGRVVSPARITSYHEAGHAVVAEALGLHVYSAALDHEDSDDAGYTALTASFAWSVDWAALYAASLSVPKGLFTLRPPKRLTPRQQAQLDADITVACAGLAAESLLLEGRASQNWSGTDCTDRLDAEAAAAMLGLTARQSRALIALRRQAVRPLLETRWGEVQAVAALLRRKRRRAAWTWRELRGVEVRRVLREARR